MTDFTFSSTAECDLCGAYLSSSDEECDHDGKTVSKHIFRRLHEGRDSITGVECTYSQKWYKLEEKVGDDWIAYQYIGTKEQVNRWLTHGQWGGIGDLPMISMSTSAPSDVGESDDE